MQHTTQKTQLLSVTTQTYQGTRTSSTDCTTHHAERASSGLPATACQAAASAEACLRHTQTLYANQKAPTMPHRCSCDPRKLDASAAPPTLPCDMQNMRSRDAATVQQHQPLYASAAVQCHHDAPGAVPFCKSTSLVCCSADVPINIRHQTSDIRHIPHCR